jgi:hypothetical protein
MLVVLDSNILLSALISPYGAPHKIYKAWRQHYFELATCREQVEELRRASCYLEASRDSAAAPGGVDAEQSAKCQDVSSCPAEA